MSSPVTFNTTARRASESEFPEQWDGLVAAWSAIEGGGRTAFDWSGRGHAGELMNGATWSSGLAGHCLSFDGVNDWVKIPHDTSLNLTATRTISLWVNFASLASGRYPCLVEKRFQDNNVDESPFSGFTITYGSPSDPTLYLSHIAVGDTLVSWSPAVGEWYNIVWSYSDGTSTVYINGVQVASAALSPSISNSQPIHLGSTRTNYADGFFHGLLDDVKVYSRTFTADRIKAMYALGPKSHLMPRLMSSYFAAQLAAAANRRRRLLMACG